MTTTVGSPTEVCNLALDVVGYPERIGDLFEGTKQAMVALRFYAQTRDDLLRSKPWTFARRDVALTLLKTAPPGGYGYNVVWTTAYPPPPWIYEYAYPSVDCLEVRSLRGTPLVIPSFDPAPVTWRDANDQSLAPPARVILTNMPKAIAVYTAQITDVTTWPPDFIEDLVDALARRFTVPLGVGANLQNAEALEQVATEQAATQRG